MHKIDGAGVAPGGLFREGNPSTGTRATTVTADFMNAVQTELINVILEAGITLNKVDNTQLVQAIRLLTTAAKTPVGTVIEGYWVAAPAGYALLKGDVVSRTGIYAALWAHAQANDLVVSEAAWGAGATGLFTSGNGSTNFRLPDIRAEFIRGVDGGRGIDVGRTLGSLQLSENKEHSHEGSTDSAGLHTHADGVYANMLRPPYEGSLTGFDELDSGTEQAVGEGDSAPMVEAGAHEHEFTTDAAGGIESRPRNIALNRAIKL